MTRYTQEEKDHHVAQWRSSGNSKRAYSKSTGVKYKTLLTWILSAQKKDGSYVPRMEKQKNFIPISVSSATQEINTVATIEISYPNGVHLSLPSTIELSELKSLLIS